MGLNIDRCIMEEPNYAHMTEVPVSGADPGGGLWGLKPPPPPYLINMLSIIMKFCLSIII